MHLAFRFTSVEMQVTVTDDAVRTMRELRQQAGVNEIGGVLLGIYDIVRNIAHVVAAVPALSDSKQTLTYFIRGIKDLKPRIERLAEASAERCNTLVSGMAIMGGFQLAQAMMTRSYSITLKNTSDPLARPRLWQFAAKETAGSGRDGKSVGYWSE